MPVFTAQDYTANANESGITFTPKKGNTLTVPYGALETVKWAPNTKKTQKGKAPLTQVNFVYRNKEQNILPKPLRIGDSFANATMENIGAIDYIRNQIMNATPLPEWKQEVDPETLKKANGKRAIKIVIGIIVAIVIAILCFSNCGGDNNSAESDTQQSQDVSAMKHDVRDICQEKVKEQLKSPSTAKFRNFLNDTEVIPHTDESGKVVRLTHKTYVDAQNSFGAMIRINYFCEAKVTSTPGEYLVSTELIER